MGSVADLSNKLQSYGKCKQSLILTSVETLMGSVDYLSNTLQYTDLWEV
jgi:hypothetical protein